jgi:hypothetical protein
MYKNEIIWGYILLFFDYPDKSLRTGIIDLEYTSAQKFALWTQQCDSLMNIEMKISLDKMLTDVSFSQKVGHITILYSSQSTDTVECPASHYKLSVALENLSATKICCVHPHPTPDLNNSTILFAPSVQFLGLHLHSKHLRWLCVKCQQSLNILKVLSGTSLDVEEVVIL